MARNISYREAINEALVQEMERDSRVVVFGEDNVGGTGGFPAGCWTPRSPSRHSSGRRSARLPAVCGPSPS
jgi:hypothetical protein